MSTRARSGFVPTAIELIEESVHLLREAPPGTFAIYFAGTAPFVLGLLFFWAFMTWFTPPPEANAWASCGLVALFAWMKVAQAEFCARLMAQRLAAPVPRWSLGRHMRVAGCQMRIQAWGLVLLPMAFVISLPFGWVYAFFQNACVLGDARDARKAASEQAELWPGQNHLGLLLIFAVGLTAWANLAAAFWAIPWLANHLLGIENVFGFSGWWQYNTTFLASVTCLAWLVTDPLVKAFYTLRIFYGRARVTGEDLRVELEMPAAAGSRGRTLAALVFLIAVSLGAPSLRAAGAPAAAANPAALDSSIDEVLSGADFRWRLRPPAPVVADAADGPLKHFVRAGFEILKGVAKAVGRLGRRLMDWLDGLFPGKEGVSRETQETAGTPILRIVLYAFAAAVLVLLCVVVTLAIRNGGKGRTALSATKVAPPRPDLADEGSHAGQLTPDGWLELAREQLAKGEWRLAWRALYLATLARLAAEGLISLAMYKTNLDYEREVARRSLERREVWTQFASRRGAFESVWYGNREPSESTARQWLVELEGPRSP